MNSTQHDRAILDSIKKDIEIINSNMKLVTKIIDSNAEDAFKAIKMKSFLYTCYLAYTRITIALEKLPEHTKFLIETESVDSWYASNILLVEYKAGFEQVYTRLTNWSRNLLGF